MGIKCYPHIFINQLSPTDSCGRWCAAKHNRRSLNVPTENMPQCQIGQASCMNVKVFSCLQASWTWWLLFLWLAPQAPELLSHAFCKKPQHFHWPSPQQKHSPCNWLCFHRPFLVPNLDWVSPEAQGKFRNVFRWGNKPMTTKPAGKHKHWSHDYHIIQKQKWDRRGGTVHGKRMRRWNVQVN